MGSCDVYNFADFDSIFERNIFNESGIYFLLIYIKTLFQKIS